MFVSIDAPTSQRAPRRRRADAERNIRRILEFADKVVRRDGADASIEEIARLAKVSTATLYRHFPSRMALMEAVFRGRMDALCADARRLAHEAHADDALEVWMHTIVSDLIEAQGMLSALTTQGIAESDAEGNFASGIATLLEAATDLVSHARDQRVIRSDVTPQDVVDVIAGIALTLDRIKPEGQDVAARADHLLDLAMNGLSSRN
ncbi:TetR/AcrR family transcriptional regulator [Sphaerisporangium sp. NPDC051011]|uniref:TetR/AcrR family transcriptional regulator n=1 Tax=Sphaerisporangium sp. NPDC051011 TaxID=3155792 RepID=UPI0033F87BFF